MTTSIFPADKTQPFVADNGVTYVWEADRWRVKQYKLDDAALEDYATEEWTEEKIAEAMLDGTVDLTSYATKTYSDAEDDKLQNQIDELGVTKGKVARYIVDNVSGTPVSRAGQLSTNNPFWSNVVVVSFGTEDADNVLTKPMNDDDIIEFVDPANGKVSRYKITDASGAPTLVAVEFISGNCDFALGAERQVFIYPQNASSASKEYVDAQDQLLDDKKLNLAGGTLTNSLTFKRGNKSSAQFGIEPNSGTSDTNIYVFNDGQMRLRSSHTDSIDDRVGSHIVLDPNGGTPETKIYNVVTPTNDTMAANKAYVDAQGGGVPAGCIMIWMNTDPPAGWLKLKGESFDIGVYPLLHAYLQQSEGYTSGKLPDWRGHYPGQLGDHLNGDVGIKLPQQTAKPSGGSPYSSNSIPNGNTRTFNGAGGTSAYSDGTARPSIDSGWDDVTRPKTVAVHFIIKHD